MYRLPNLIDDVAKKAKMKRSQAVEIWDTFNRYVTHSFEQNRCVNVANFCKVGWTIERRGSGVTYRPHFQLLHPFLEAFALEWRKGTRDLAEKDFAPGEELNFSKAAIRFSNSLTKDQMFSGLKLFRNQLGEVMSTGQQVSVDMELGQLICRDRRPDFVFVASVYKRSGLPIPSDVADTEYKPSATFAAPNASDLALLRLKGSATGKMGSSSDMPSTADTYRREGGAEVMSVLPEEDPGDTLGDEDIERAAKQHSLAGRSDFGEGSMASGTSQHPPLSHRKQERAYQEALDRHISDMEGKAAEAIKEREQWESHLGRCIQQEREDMQHKRALSMQNQEFLRQQMEWNERRRGANRDTYLAAAGTHDFPKLSEIPGPEVKERTAMTKQALKHELDKQVSTNTAMKRMQKEREKALEARHLQQNQEEMVALQQLEHHKKELTKQALREAWGGATRIKNLERAIENHSGVAPNQSHLVFASATGEVDRSGLRTSGSSVAPKSARTPRGGAARSLALHRDEMLGKSSSLNRGGQLISGIRV